MKDDILFNTKQLCDPKVDLDPPVEQLCRVVRKDTVDPRIPRIDRTGNVAPTGQPGAPVAVDQALANYLLGTVCGPLRFLIWSAELKEMI